ncbi:unnamed protein product, partial [Durusdinium trenchii]
MSCRPLCWLPPQLVRRGLRTERNLPFSCRVIFCAIIGASTLYAASWPWHHLPRFVPDHRAQCDKWMMLSALLIVAAVYILCILKSHPRTTYTNDAKWCMFCWLLATVAYQFCGDGGLFGHSRQAGEMSLTVSVLVAVHGVVIGWMLILFETRIRQLGLGKSTSRLWVCVMSGSFMLSSVCMSFHAVSKLLALIGLLITQAVFLTIWLTCSTMACRTCCHGIHVLMLESKSVSGVPKQHALWAAQILRKELFLGATLFTAVFATVLTVDCVRYFAILHPMEYERDKESYWTIASALRCFLVVVATVDLALFSGILWQGSPPKENAELESSREVATASMLDFLDASQHAMYCTKVQELAHRGFHLQSLLNFWEELLEGDVMPSFDPRWSQTNDVVRQAIIPSSRVEEGGRALAEIWEERPVLPQNMVTHHWSNSFAHLVGAMLADALERMTYEELAEELCSLSGVTHIRRKLREAQRLESTYWVCAFSVNQHASICGGYGPEPRRGTADWKEWDKKRHDSVSFHRFKLCDCHEPKLMSHQEAACELNK